MLDGKSGFTCLKLNDSILCFDFEFLTGSGHWAMVAPFIFES